MDGARPRYCAHSVGSQLTKVAKGFRELFKVGLLDEEPAVRVRGHKRPGALLWPRPLSLGLTSSGR